MFGIPDVGYISTVCKYLLLVGVFFKCKYEIMAVLT
jgi:hypothetical protein